MKYYIYISDAKVDMLFPQVPHEIKKKVATEFGIDLKVLVAKRKVESESEDNRISRLEAVLSFIGKYGNVGSVDEPDEYFEDTMPMRFLSLGDSLIYLSGHTERTLLGLGGSGKHIIGALPNPNTPISSSFAFVILELLSKLHSTTTMSDKEVRDCCGFGLRAVAGLESARQGEGFSVYENIEFFAKRLACDKATPDKWSMNDEDHIPFEQVLLGSPLYLAKTD